jgi:type IV pilus assembly protein PilA
MKNTKNKRLNNSGFSLVELIIVVAIMAVLVGVLAPQYLKYVEKSRASSDRTNIDAIVSALQVYGADTDATLAYASGDKIEITRTASAVPATTTALGAALNNAGITGNLQLKNKSTFQKVTITVTIASDGVVTVKAEETT